MESISKILDAISAESRETADKIIENGRNSAEDLNKFYMEEARATEEEILMRAVKRADEIQQRSVSQAGIESRNIKLSAKKNAIEKAFINAGGKLNALTKEQKKAFYEKLIRHNCRSNDVKVQLNENDKKTLGHKLKVSGVKIAIDDNSGDFSGGLIVKEEMIETDCTFEVIINNAKKKMESEIAAILFHEVKEVNHDEL